MLYDAKWPPLGVLAEPRGMSQLPDRRKTSVMGNFPTNCIIYCPSLGMLPTRLSLANL